MSELFFAVVGRGVFQRAPTQAIRMCGLIAELPSAPDDSPLTSHVELGETGYRLIFGGYWRLFAAVSTRSA